MDNKTYLINRLITHPKDERSALERFVNEELSEGDIENAINFLEENGERHRISHLSHGDGGTLNIQLQTGVTYLN